MRNIRLKIALFSLVFLLVCSSTIFAIELFPSDEIRPGLRGNAKTVISGNTIEEFEVEVIGLVPQSPPLNNLIMIKVKGDAIERSGGISQGMSGSPVYIDGRLLGAISYTYKNTDHRVGLVTPAADMFRIYDQMPGIEPILPEDALPIRTPLITEGLNQRNAKFLLDALGLEQVQALPAMTNGKIDQVAPIEPGSMIGVQLMRGDFQVSSFGTVTHLADDGRFIAFGHPFTHRGNVDLFASAAYVHYSMPNTEVPYKIVSLGSTIGTIEQDRYAGLGGRLGAGTDYVPIRITVRDLDQGSSQDYRVEVIKEGDLMIPLITSSAYQGVDATLDRIGAGTSLARLEFKSRDFSQRMIRENLFYSDSDIAIWSLTDLLTGLELLVLNDLQTVCLDEVKIELDITQERKTASIEEATPSKSYVRAGENVDVEVYIRPYRGKPETRTLRMQIPEDIAPGLVTVTVRSGGAGYYVVKPPVHTSILDPDAEVDEPIQTVISGAETLDGLIDEYMERERNNEIIAEFYPLYEQQELEPTEDYADFAPEYEFLDTLDPLSYFSWVENSMEPVKVRLSTQFVLDGMATFDLNIY